MRTLVKRKLTCEQLEAELAKVEAQIDAAYWAFTRQARALPPVLAVPGAYARRRNLCRLLGRKERSG